MASALARLLDDGTARRWAVTLAALSPLSLIVNGAEWIVTALALLFLAHCVRRRDFAFAREPWFAALAALWVFALARTLIAAQDASSVLTALQWIRFPLYAAALAAWALPDPQARRWLGWACVATVTFFVSDCLLQFVTGRDVIGRPLFAGDRLTSVFRKPGVGAQIAWLAPPAALFLFRLGRVGQAVALGAAALVVVLLAGDRMGLLQLLAAVLLIGLTARRLRRAALGFAALAAVTLGLIFAFSPSVYKRQVGATVDMAQKLEKSHYGIVFDSGLKVIFGAPVFGVGVRNYQVACVDPRNGPLEVGEQKLVRCLGHPHNLYLQWAAEAGLIGAALYAAFAVAALLALWRIGRSRPDDVLFIALAVGFALRVWPIGSSTSFYSGWATGPMFLVLGWALAYARARSDDPV